MRPIITLLAAFALVLAACTNTTADESTTTTSAPAATPTTVAGPADSVTTSTSSAPTPDLSITTDGVTVTDDTIYLGFLADLTGPFSTSVVDVLDAQVAFWAKVNDEGGIAGRSVELLINNTGYDVETHAEQYQAMKDRVVMFAHSTGSQHTLGIVPDLVADQRLAIPLTWYSGWADPVLGSNLLETGSSYCMEAINTVSWYATQFEEASGRTPRLATVGFPDDYGFDSATGVGIAAAARSLDVTYQGQYIPGVTDMVDVAREVVASGADLTFVATDPLSLVELVGTALQLGYEGQWAVASPAFSTRLLDTALGGYFSQNLFWSSVLAPIGTDAERMPDVLAVLSEAYPSRYPADGMIEGYLEFEVARQVLERAAALGDMTPEGVLAAAQSIEALDYGGLATSNTFASTDPNTSVARATAIFQPDLVLFQEQGGLSATLGAGAVSPVRVIQDFGTSPEAALYPFDGACFRFPSA